MFQFRRPFDKSPFILGVVGEHFRSERYFAGAPRRNVAILFGHHLYATTKQDNEVRSVPDLLTEDGLEVLVEGKTISFLTAQVCKLLETHLLMRKRVCGASLRPIRPRLWLRMPKL
jgi:hypothetical protein